MDYNWSIHDAMTALYIFNVNICCWVGLVHGIYNLENKSSCEMRLCNLCGSWIGSSIFYQLVVQSSAYQLSQLESLFPSEQLFVDYFNVGLPTVSVVPDPLNGLFWLYSVYTSADLAKK